jgi:hypothetical protein
MAVELGIRDADEPSSYAARFATARKRRVVRGETTGTGHD